MWIYPDLPIENVDLLDCENRCFHHGVNNEQKGVESMMSFNDSRNQNGN